MLLTLSVPPPADGDLETPGLGADQPDGRRAPIYRRLRQHLQPRAGPPAGIVISSPTSSSATRACPTPTRRTPRRSPVAGPARRDARSILLGSRYCETDRMSELAWSLFGKTPLGWARVQAIVDYVHHRIGFGYEHARPTKDRLRGACRGAQRGLPRLRPPGHHPVPLHEHPGPLLHRLSRRHRRAGGRA